MVDYWGAIKRPYQRFGTLLLGLPITLVPILNFATFGFALKCATKKEGLPDWSDFGKLWVNGLLAFVISIIWSVPAFILFFAVGGGRTMLTPAAISITPGMMVYYIVVLITGYLGSVAVISFAVKKEFGAAFSFREIFKKALTAKWLVAWILLVLISLILGVIGAILMVLLAITIIGPLIVVLLLIFSIVVTGYTILGEAYTKIR